MTISDDPAATVRALLADAVTRRTPCGAGDLVWHQWGRGEPLVLLHGAFGSWLHWVLPILELARRRRVIAVDMPGYGDSAALPERVEEARLPDALAAPLAEGLDRILPADVRFDLVGFSFGGIVGGHVAARMGARVRTLMLIGTGGLGLSPGRGAGPLRPIRSGMSPAETAEAHRYNLGRLMFGDPAKVDDLAVHIQIENARRARTRSGSLPESDVLRRALPRVTARLAGLWGQRDVFAAPHLGEREALLTTLDPAAFFRILPGVGHWVPYEAPVATVASIREALGD